MWRCRGLYYVKPILVHWVKSIHVCSACVCVQTVCEKMLWFCPSTVTLFYVSPGNRLWACIYTHKCKRTHTNTLRSWRVKEICRKTAVCVGGGSCSFLYYRPIVCVCVHKLYLGCSKRPPETHIYTHTPAQDCLSIY